MITMITIITNSQWVHNDALENLGPGGTRAVNVEGNFDLIVVKILWGHFGATDSFFEQWIFKILLSLKLWNGFFSVRFLYVPCDSHHRSYFLEFWNLNIKKENEKRSKFYIVSNGKMKIWQISWKRLTVDQTDVEFETREVILKHLLVPLIS